MTRTYAAARPARAARPGYPATDAQVQFVRDLAAEVHKDNAAEFILGHQESGTFDDRAATSRVIDALIQARKDARRHAGAKAPAIDMPEPGYYCAVWNSRLNFYRVVEGKGRWAGRTFLNRYSSDRELGRLSRAEQEAVAAAILADPLGAGMEFAAKTTRCRSCARRLTDAASRVRGQGPDCAGLR